MTLHNLIMNIQVNTQTISSEVGNPRDYKLGHRDARHASAELSLKADARIEELETTIQKLLFAITPVSNAAYNLAWQHRDEQSVHKNISVLDELRTQAYKLLENK